VPSRTILDLSPIPAIAPQFSNFPLQKAGIARIVAEIDNSIENKGGSYGQDYAAIEDDEEHRDVRILFDGQRYRV
jgi:hypothetical protein